MRRNAFHTANYTADATKKIEIVAQKESVSRIGERLVLSLLELGTRRAVKRQTENGYTKCATLYRCRSFVVGHVLSQAERAITK